MKKYLSEVQLELKKLKGGKQPSKYLPENYIGSEYKYFKFYNVRVPQIRSLQKRGFSFSELPIREQWKIWDYIWQNSKVFELSLIAIHFVNRQPIEELYRHRNVFCRWIDRIDNWALSDEFSCAMAKLYEHSPNDFQKTYLNWNKSKNPWKRRISIVGLEYYANLRKKHVPYKTIINLVDPHLEDTHYYVQKAVGWTLRECWKVYPSLTFGYLKKNAHQIPSGGWTAATEKLTKSDKNSLTKLRKVKKSSFRKTI